MNAKTRLPLLALAVTALLAGGCMKHEVQKSATGSTPGGTLESTAATDVMTLPASRGNVTFNHKKHQDLLKDCTKCHDKGPGKIEGFGKDWAHSRCKGCHTTMNQGPTGCNDCHKK